MRIQLVIETPERSEGQPSIMRRLGAGARRMVNAIPFEIRRKQAVKEEPLALEASTTE